MAADESQVTHPHRAAVIDRDIQRPEYAGAVADQVMAASERKGPGDLEALLRSNGTWSVT